MAIIKIDSEQLDTLHTTVSMQSTEMTDIVSRVTQITYGLDMDVQAASGIQSSLFTLQKNCVARQETLQNLAAVVLRVGDDFIETDERLQAQANQVIYNGVDYAVSVLTDISLELFENMQEYFEFLSLFGVLSGVQTTYSENISWLAVGIDSFIDFGAAIDGGISTVEKISGFLDTYLGIGELDIGVLSLFTYANDGQSLVEAIFNGDMGAIYDLTEKYITKYAASGAGFVNGILIDVVWNAGENFGVGIVEFIEDPSFTGLIEVAFESTIGSMLETGVEIGYGAAELVYTMMGLDFDQMWLDTTGVAGIDGMYKSFEMTADYLGGIIEDGVAEIGDFVGETVDAVGDFVGETADAVGDFVSDAADTIADTAEAVGDAVVDGAKAVGDTVAEWGDAISGLFSW